MPSMANHSTSRKRKPERKAGSQREDGRKGNNVGTINGKTTETTTKDHTLRCFQFNQKTLHTNTFGYKKGLLGLALAN
jgi:hypothetical protein